VGLYETTDTWQDVAIIRRCRSCHRQLPISSFIACQRTCAICRNLHYRSYVLTDKGREAIGVRPREAVA
jgi:hypothetical protein